MYSLLLLTVMAQPIDPAPATVVIFGRDRWYQTVKGDEETFVGVLERIPGTGRNSRNAFCLVMGRDGQNNTRELFIGTDNIKAGLSNADLSGGGDASIVLNGGCGAPTVYCYNGETIPRGNNASVVPLVPHRQNLTVGATAFA